MSLPRLAVAGLVAGFAVSAAADDLAPPVINASVDGASAPWCVGA